MPLQRLWLKYLLQELGIISPKAPIIWVDNLSTIALASNPILCTKIKHIELDYHFVREKVAAQKLKVLHVPSMDQIANIFSKSLSHQFFTQLRNKLNIVLLASLELRGHVNHSSNTSSAAAELISKPAAELISNADKIIRVCRIRVISKLIN